MVMMVCTQVGSKHVVRSDMCPRSMQVTPPKSLVSCTVKAYLSLAEGPPDLVPESGLVGLLHYRVSTTPDISRHLVLGVAVLPSPPGSACLEPLMNHQQLALGPLKGGHASRPLPVDLGRLLGCTRLQAKQD